VTECASPKSIAHPDEAAAVEKRNDIKGIIAALIR